MENVKKCAQDQFSLNFAEKFDTFRWVTRSFEGHKRYQFILLCFITDEPLQIKTEKNTLVLLFNHFRIISEVLIFWKATPKENVYILPSKVLGAFQKSVVLCKNTTMPLPTRYVFTTI